MTLAHCPAPTTAERVRSTCVRADGALLAVDNAEPRSTELHHLLADYAPLPLREPVRSLVWIRGRLHQVPLTDVRDMLDLIAAEHPHPALLQVQTPASRAVVEGDAQYVLARLEIEAVVVTDATGA